MELWGNVRRAKVERRGTSVADYLDWKAQSQSFDGMALYTTGNFTLTGFDEPERVPGRVRRRTGTSSCSGSRRNWAARSTRGRRQGSAARRGRGPERRPVETAVRSRSGRAGPQDPAQRQGVHDHRRDAGRGFAASTTTADLWAPLMMAICAGGPEGSRRARSGGARALEGGRRTGAGAVGDGRDLQGAGRAISRDQRGAGRGDQPAPEGDLRRHASAADRAAGGGRIRAADRVHECREPDAGAVGGPAAGDRGARRAGRRPRADDPSAHDRRARAGNGGRRRGTAAGAVGNSRRWWRGAR